MTPLREYLNFIADDMAALDHQADQLTHALDLLRDQGITQATAHWRKKNLLELVHPTGSDYHQRHGRRREYIGTDPVKIQHALDCIDRHNEYRVLLAERGEIYHKINKVSRLVRSAYTILNAKQEQLI